MWKLHNPAAEKAVEVLILEHEKENKAVKLVTGFCCGCDWVIILLDLPRLMFYHLATGGRPKDSSLLEPPLTSILHETNRKFVHAWIFVCVCVISLSLPVLHLKAFNNFYPFHPALHTLRRYPAFLC